MDNSMERLERKELVVRIIELIELRSFVRYINLRSKNPVVRLNTWRASLNARRLIIRQLNREKENDWRS